MGVSSRTIAAFILAPLATPLAIAILFLAGWVLRIGWFAERPAATVLSSIYLYVTWSPFLAYPAALLLGIPAYAIARRRRWRSMRQAIAVGAVVALAPLFVFFAYVIAMDGRAAFTAAVDATWWTLLFALCGGSSGAAFWWIAMRGRPA